MTQVLKVLSLSRSWGIHPRPYKWSGDFLHWTHKNTGIYSSLQIWKYTFFLLSETREGRKNTGSRIPRGKKNPNKQTKKPPKRKQPKHRH